MIQLYVFIIALAALLGIVFRRKTLAERVRKIRFKEEVKERVEEIKKEERETTPERFKEKHHEREEKKKFNIAEYKEAIRRAEVLIAHEKWGEAKQHLIHALGVTKDEFEALNMLAEVYFKSGDFKRAETLYLRLIEIDPQNAGTYEKWGRLLTKKKRFKEAIHAYVKAVEIDDKNDQTLLALGKLYDLMMRPSLAAECFRRAAELKPRDVSYLFLLAESCERDSDYDNALFTYERILTLEPYNEMAKSRAQDVRMKMNEMEKAFA